MRRYTTPALPTPKALETYTLQFTADNVAGYQLWLSHGTLSLDDLSPDLISEITFTAACDADAEDYAPYKARLLGWLADEEMPAQWLCNRWCCDSTAHAV